METETLTSWIIIFICNSLFCLWLIKWGGARYLEGTFKAGFLLSSLAPTWDEEVIKLFAWLLLIVGTLGFMLGLFVPDMRISGWLL